MAAGHGPTGDALMEALATITSTQGYTGLQQALRARWLALGIRGEDLDRMAGLAERYGARLLGPWPTKHMGTDSLGRIMDVLAVKLVLVEDTELLAEISRRLGVELQGRDVTSRNIAGGQNNANTAMPTQRKRKRRRFLAFKGNPELARQLRNRAVLKQSARQRSRIARIAANARWSKSVRSKSALTTGKGVTAKP